MKPRAMFTRCCSPPEKVAGGNDHSRSGRLSRARSARALAVASSRATPRLTNGSATTSTVVTRGTRQVLEQIEAQLNKVVNVRRVHDVTRDPNGVERELALVKVRGQGAERVEALRIAEIFRAKPVDTTLESFVFEVSGAPSKIDKFLDLMRPLGLVELSRTGVLSIERGVEGM